MLVQQSSASIKQACLILFGPEVEPSPDFLSYLQPEGLKAAFRSKALCTHPDRAAVTGQDRDQLNEQFLKVVWAYEQLKGAILNPGAALAASRPRPPQGGFTNAPRYYRGRVPSRVLRLGEFLYYSGLISWQDFTASLYWQRRQRPAFGEIARQWNLLSQEEVAQVLASRQLPERFGQAARRQGLLSDFWVRTILRRQAKMQPLLGRYFVEKGLLEAEQLARMLVRLRLHKPPGALPLPLSPLARARRRTAARRLLSSPAPRRPPVARVTRPPSLPGRAQGQLHPVLRGQHLGRGGAHFLGGNSLYLLGIA